MRAGEAVSGVLVGVSGVLPMALDNALSFYESLASWATATRGLCGRMEEVRALLGCGDQNWPGAPRAAAARDHSCWIRRARCQSEPVTFARKSKKDRFRGVVICQLTGTSW